MKRFLISLIALMLSYPLAAQSHAEEAVGDTFEILLRYETESESSDGASGSSGGGSAYLETIEDIREDGIVRLFDIDFPKDKKRPLRLWEYPARILDRGDGKPILLNRTELEARRDAWLEGEEIPSEVCGKYYFTWNAFSYNCDPEDKLPIIAYLLPLPRKIEAGASVSHEAALGEGSLVADEGEKATFSVQLDINPDYFRNLEAQAAVIGAQILGEDLKFDDALAAQQQVEVSGSISISFSEDRAKNIRTKITKTVVHTTDAAGVSERRSSTETLTRSLVAETAD